MKTHIQSIENHFLHQNSERITYFMNFSNNLCLKFQSSKTMFKKRTLRWGHSIMKIPHKYIGEGKTQTRTSRYPFICLTNSCPSSGCISC